MPPTDPERIRVLFIDHTAGVVPFQRKFDAVAARPEIELTVLGPDRWVENFRPVRLRAEDRPRYRLRVGPVVWPGYENRGFFRSGISGAIRASRPHLIHLWEEPFSLIALQSVWARDWVAPAVPVIFSSSDDLSFGFRYPYRPSWLYARIERHIHERSAGGIVINPQVTEVLRSKGFSGPLEQIPHGLDLGPYEATGPRLSDRGEGNAGRALTIGYVGRLLRQKGVDLLIRAYTQLEHDAAARPRLVIVGSGPEEAALRDLASRLGLDDRVSIRPGVPHEDVPALLHEIDILVLPSRRVPGWQEQFGRILIEGMAAGCAVVGSNCGAIPGVLGDAGLVFAEEDVEGLAGTLSRLIRDPELVRALVERGRDRVRAEYTWDAVAAKLIPFYRRILSEAARP